jgi:hypothetical protein
MYALEIKLKVVICHRLDIPQLPQVFKTHNLEALMLHAGLSTKIRDVRRPRGVVKNWDELLITGQEIDHARYVPNLKWNQAHAIRTLDQLRHPIHGVLLWLDRQI